MESPPRKVLYLEPVGGVAGDMFLAAALDLGVDQARLEAALAGLGVEPFQLRIQRAERHSITGTHLDVVVPGEETAHAHRALSDIQRLIREAPTLSPSVKARALTVFQVLGEAEARIHGVPVERIHFHEVGAVDSIVDICGAAVVLELLGDPEVFAAPPPLGSGTARTAHGPMPIPAPATLEILRDLPVRFEGVGELTTPTGAALLKAFARVGAPPPLVVERVGYGVGTKDFPDRPNVLRASLGRRAAEAQGGRAPSGAETFVVEANLDDCSPQLLGHLMERLLAEGALDAYVSPLTMKKGRPGHLLGVVATAASRAKLTELVLRESTTLGVRAYPVERAVLERRFVPVQTRYGEVTVKLGLLGGEVVNVAPEYEDCRARAQEHHVPLKQVWAEALSAYGQDAARGGPAPAGRP